jgi:Protein of unknown function (DUF1499)
LMRRALSNGPGPDDCRATLRIVIRHPEWSTRMRFFRQGSAAEERDFARHPDIVRPVVARAVRELGWQARTTQSGTIEAVWTSAVFRFKGDVSIKTLIVKGATRLRVESVSRRGGFDFGQNARRVRDFFFQVDLHLSV